MDVSVRKERVEREEIFLGVSPGTGPQWRRQKKDRRRGSRGRRLEKRRVRNAAPLVPRTPLRGGASGKGKKVGGSRTRHLKSWIAKGLSEAVPLARTIAELKEDQKLNGPLSEGKVRLGTKLQARIKFRSRRAGLAIARSRGVPEIDGIRKWRHLLYSKVGGNSRQASHRFDDEQSVGTLSTVAAPGEYRESGVRQELSITATRKWGNVIAWRWRCDGCGSEGVEPGRQPLFCEFCRYPLRIITDMRSPLGIYSPNQRF